MNGDIIVALISVGFLVILNIVAVAFWGGKLWQKVNDLPCVQGRDCPQGKAQAEGKKS